MVGDHFTDKWNEPPQRDLINRWIHTPSEVSRAEFDKLKAEVQEMKKLLERAKKYDEANKEPNCEMEDKMAKLRQIAALVDIDLEDIIGTAK